MGIRGGDVKVPIRAPSDQLEGDFKKGQGKVRRGAGKLGKAAKAGFAILGGAALAGVGAATAAIGGMISKFGEMNATLRPAANRIGIAAARLNTLATAANRLGSEDGLEGITDSAQELSLRLQDMTGDGFRADAALAQIGLSGEELRKKSPEDALLATIAALQGVEDQQKKNWLADELFGGSWEHIAGVLNATQGEFQGLIAQEEKQEAAIAKGLESQQRLASSWRRIKLTIAGFLSGEGPGLLSFLATGLEFVEKQLPAALAWADAMRDRLMPHLNELSWWLVNIYLPNVRRWTEKLRSELLPALDTLGNWLAKVGIPLLMRFGETTANSVNRVLDNSVSLFGIKLLPLLRLVWGFLQSNFNAELQILIAHLRNMWQTIRANLIPILFRLKEFLVTTALPAFQMLTDWLSEHAIPLWNRLVEGVRSLSGLFSTDLLTSSQGLSNYFTEELWPALQRLWLALTKDLIPGILKFADAVGPILMPIIQALFKILSTIIVPFLKGTLVNAINAVSAVFTILGGLLSGDFSKAWLGVQQLVGAVGNQIINVANAIAQAVAAMVNGVIQAVGKAGEKIASLPIPGAASIGNALKSLGSLRISVPTIPGINLAGLPSLPPAPSLALPSLPGAGALPGATRAAGGVPGQTVNVNFPTTLIQDDVGITERVAEAQHLANRLGLQEGVSE